MFETAFKQLSHCRRGEVTSGSSARRVISFSVIAKDQDVLQPDYILTPRRAGLSASSELVLHNYRVYNSLARVLFHSRYFFMRLPKI